MSVAKTLLVVELSEPVPCATGYASVRVFAPHWHSQWHTGN